MAAGACAALAVLLSLAYEPCPGQDSRAKARADATGTGAGGGSAEQGPRCPEGRSPR